MPVIVSYSVSLIPACKLLQNNLQQYPFFPGTYTEHVLTLPPLSCSLWLGLHLLCLPSYSIQPAMEPTPPSQAQEEDQVIVRAFEIPEKLQKSMGHD